MERNLDFFKDKKILITGGGGYLGSKVAEALLPGGADITLLDISFNPLSEFLVDRNDNIKKCHIDITHKNDVENLCSDEKPDYIFHCCGLLQRERNFKLYDSLYKVNVIGTMNLLEALQPVNYKGFFFTSSSEVYGSKNHSPFHENQVPMPVSPYSLTKLMAENLIQAYSDIHNKPYTILRIFNFYGADMPENFFINQLIATLRRGDYFKMTGGEQLRDFLHTDQVVAAIIEISKSEKSKGEIINVCSGRPVMLKELGLKIARKLKKEHLLKIGAIPYRDNEVWNMTGMNEKLKKYISFFPDDGKNEFGIEL